MENLGTVTLESKRLILRQFTIEDAPKMYKNWASSPNVTKYLTWPYHTSEEISKQILELWIPQYSNLDNYQWAIELKSIKEVIGSISVVAIKPRIKAVSIGYCIGESWWNEGYTSEALKEIIRFLFEEVKVNRIEARHSIDNPNSGLVMEKCGMSYEGTTRQGDLSNNGLTDCKYYAILMSDYCR